MEKFPENTMVAFDEALRVGSHGLETGTPRPMRVTKRRAHVP